MQDTTTIQLADTMMRIAHLMKHKIQFKDDQLHVSMLQLQALKFIHAHTDVTMSDIAAHFTIELPSATNLIANLCDQHFVTRYDDPSDRRLVKLKLTDEGDKLLHKAMQIFHNKVEATLAYLSKKEQQQLLKLMNTLYMKLQS